MVSSIRKFQSLKTYKKAVKSLNPIRSRLTFLRKEVEKMLPLSKDLKNIIQNKSKKSLLSFLLKTTAIYERLVELTYEISLLQVRLSKIAREVDVLLVSSFPDFMSLQKKERDEIRLVVHKPFDNVSEDLEQLTDSSNDLKVSIDKIQFNIKTILSQKQKKE